MAGVGNAWAPAPEGKRIAASLADKPETVAVFTLEGKAEKTFEIGRGVGGIGAGVSALEWSPDGATLAAIDSGGLALVDVAAGTVRRVAAAELFGRGLTHRAAFSPDSRQLACVGDSNDIVILNLADGKRKASLPAAVKPVVGVCYSPAGKKLLTWPRFGGARVTVWDLDTGKAAAQYRGSAATLTSEVASAVFSSDAKRCFAAGGDGCIHVFSPETGKTIDSHGLPSAVVRIVWSSDGREAVLGCRDGTLLVCDANTGAVRLKLEPPAVAKNLPRLLDLRMAGDRIWALQGCCVLRWRYPGGEPEAPAVPETMFSPEKTAALDPATGRVVFAAAGFVTLCQVDGARLRRVAQTLVDNSYPICYQVDVCGGQVALMVSRRTGGTFLSFHSMDKEEGVKAVPGPIIGFQRVFPTLAIIKDARSTIFAAGSTRMGAYEPVSNEWWFTEMDDLLTGRQDRAMAFSALAASGVDRLLAAGRNSGCVEVRDALTGRLAMTFAGHRGAVSALAFSPDGRRLASGGEDCTAVIWKLPTGAAAELTPEKAAALWEVLAGSDTSSAYGATLTLTKNPSAALTMLRERLAPVAVAEVPQLARLIAAMGSVKFAQRSVAGQELAKLRTDALPALRAAMKDPNLAPEPRQRIEEATERLTALQQITPCTSEELRSLRAVDVLERIGTPPAVELLTKLATGRSDARQTVAAAAALKRLTQPATAPASRPAAAAIMAPKTYTGR